MQKVGTTDVEFDTFVKELEDTLNSPEFSLDIVNSMKERLKKLTLGSPVWDFSDRLQKALTSGSTPDDVDLALIEIVEDGFKIQQQMKQEGVSDDLFDELLEEAIAAITSTEEIVHGEKVDKTVEDLEKELENIETLETEMKEVIDTLQTLLTSDVSDNILVDGLIEPLSQGKVIQEKMLESHIFNTTFNEILDLAEQIVNDFEEAPMQKVNVEKVKEKMNEFTNLETQVLAFYEKLFQTLEEQEKGILSKEEGEKKLAEIFEEGKTLKESMKDAFFLDSGFEKEIEWLKNKLSPSEPLKGGAARPDYPYRPYYERNYDSYYPYDDKRVTRRAYNPSGYYDNLPRRKTYKRTTKSSSSDTDIMDKKLPAFVVNIDVVLFEKKPCMEIIPLSVESTLGCSDARRKIKSLWEGLVGATTKTIRVTPPMVQKRKYTRRNRNRPYAYNYNYNYP